MVKVGAPLFLAVNGTYSTLKRHRPRKVAVPMLRRLIWSNKATRISMEVLDAEVFETFVAKDIPRSDHSNRCVVGHDWPVAIAKLGIEHNPG